MFKEDLYNQKMTKTFDVFVKELASLRTGRANASMLDLIKVDVYGQKMPINQLATITTPEPRVINIQVWDANNVSLLDPTTLMGDVNELDKRFTFNCAELDAPIVNALFDQSKLLANSKVFPFNCMPLPALYETVSFWEGTQETPFHVSC